MNFLTSLELASLSVINSLVENYDLAVNASGFSPVTPDLTCKKENPFSDKKNKTAAFQKEARGMQVA